MRCMKNNYECTKDTFNACQKHNVRLFYASSASVYGNGDKGFVEKEECEYPLNVYAFSKYQFDRYLNIHFKNINSQVVGLRYFNVYGPQENHKGKMASVAFHMFNQIKNNEPMKLFEGSENFRRDFIYVDDVVSVNMFFYENPDKSGIFNCGTGHAESFCEIANALHEKYKDAKVEYIPFPESLKGKYQTFTEKSTSELHLIFQSKANQVDQVSHQPELQEERFDVSILSQQFLTYNVYRQSQDEQSTTSIKPIQQLFNYQGAFSDENRHTPTITELEETDEQAEESIKHNDFDDQEIINNLVDVILSCKSEAELRDYCKEIISFKNFNIIRTKIQEKGNEKKGNIDYPPKFLEDFLSEDFYEYCSIYFCGTSGSNDDKNVLFAFKEYLENKKEMEKIEKTKKIVDELSQHKKSSEALNYICNSINSFALYCSVREMMRRQLKQTSIQKPMEEEVRNVVDFVFSEENYKNTSTAKR